MGCEAGFPGARHHQNYKGFGRRVWFAVHRVQRPAALPASCPRYRAALAPDRHRSAPAHL